MASTIRADRRQVAPGVHRLGDEAVNFYLIEHEDGLVLVDAGVPGHFGQLQEQLARLGHKLSDIRAVLLTHGHLDHTGLAERLRAEAGADIWIHRADAPILADGPRSAMRHSKPERSMVPYLLRRPGALGAPLRFARMGAFTAPRVQHVLTLVDEEPLTAVPGQPRPVLLPGHTTGSAAFHFADRGLLFTGDALVTRDDLTGHTGPGLVCRAFTHDSAAALASLDRLGALPDSLILPGHGDLFDDGPRAAAELARRAGIQ